MSRLDAVQFICDPATGQLSMYRMVGGEVVDATDVTGRLMALAMESAIAQGPEPLVLYGNKAGQRIKFTLTVTQEVVDGQAT